MIRRVRGTSLRRETRTIELLALMRFQARVVGEA